MIIEEKVKCGCHKAGRYPPGEPGPCALSNPRGFGECPIADSVWGMGPECCDYWQPIEERKGVAPVTDIMLGSDPHNPIQPKE